MPTTSQALPSPPPCPPPLDTTTLPTTHAPMEHTRFMALFSLLQHAMFKSKSTISMIRRTSPSSLRPYIVPEEAPEGNLQPLMHLASCPPLLPLPTSQSNRDQGIEKGGESQLEMW